MARFRKLTLEEAAQEFEVLDLETRRSLKGGDGTGLMWQDPNDPLNAGLYSMNQFNQMMGDNYGIMPMGLGTEDNPTYLDEVVVYGTYTGGKLNPYGTWCGIHNYYSPPAQPCSGCEEGNYSNDYPYGGDSYNNNSGDNNTNNSGDNNTVVGGGSSGGGGAPSNLYSPLLKTFKREDTDNAQQKDNSLCVLYNIKQALKTLGIDRGLDPLLNEAAKVLQGNMPDVTQKRTMIENIGIHITELETLFSHYFNITDMTGKSSLATKIDSDTNKGLFFFANFNGHNVVILDINPSSKVCTYYDPMFPDANKTAELKDLDYIYRVDELKNKPAQP